MISVQGLSKSYGQTEAVRDLSFTVNKGEVVGFLGPNGAGKSTTMRILSGFLPADTGEVRIAGFDVFTQSVKARSRIGYLPENVPLYPEMRVGEYLSYRAALKGVRSRRVAEKVEDALQLCGLPHVWRQLIGTLSKGYRQRVGLADALVNEPDILILDEPTIGLDPEQIREVRALIKGLATRHTILLSSHILSEVEMTCSRVLILNKGRIIANGTPSQLRDRTGLSLSNPVRLEAMVPDPAEAAKSLAKLPGIDSARVLGSTDGWSTFEIIPSGNDPRCALFDESVRRGWKLRELSARESSLEEIFTSFVSGRSREPENAGSTANQSGEARP
jgi:ABC-2 type transport system ATP-binding protein